MVKLKGTLHLFFLPFLSRKNTIAQHGIAGSRAKSNFLITTTMTEEKQSHDEIMQSAVDQMEDQLKTQHSKNAICFFFVFGFIIFIWKGAPLFSFGALAFFFIGMFLASFLSIPSYLIKMQIFKRIGFKQAQILKNFYWIFEMVYDFVDFLKNLIFNARSPKFGSGGSRCSQFYHCQTSAMPKHYAKSLRSFA